MTTKEEVRRHRQLVKRLEAFLERESKDPESRRMLASLQGD